MHLTRLGFHFKVMNISLEQFPKKGRHEFSVAVFSMKLCNKYAKREKVSEKLGASKNVLCND